MFEQYYDSTKRRYWRGLAAMRIAVIGAGVVGVTTAWYLSESGHEVCVLDRQPDAGLETSFANGGQISVSHAEPWANPRAPLQILRWLGREDAPLLWHLRADAAQWCWGLKFLAECRAGRTRANVAALLALGLYSRSCLGELRRRLSLDYDQLERGILHFYTEEAEFDRAVPQAELMRSFGCERVVKSAAECLAIEPALRDSTVPVLGGTYTAADESGDALKFTRALARHCAARGVELLFGTGVCGLKRGRGAVTAAMLSNGGQLLADAFVVAAGSHTPLLLRPLGISVPVIPAKGYSLTIPLQAGDTAPRVSLTDDAHKLVLSRLAQNLRVAGTAEFAGYDLRIDPRRSASIGRRVRALFPNLGGMRDAVCWAGLRPATPGNIPLIGATKLRNLYLNTGHGTLGWTLACGSARLLADLIDGRQPDVDAFPYRP